MLETLPYTRKQWQPLVVTPQFLHRISFEAPVDPSQGRLQRPETDGIKKTKTHHLHKLWISQLSGGFKRYIPPLRQQDSFHIEDHQSLCGVTFTGFQSIFSPHQSYYPLARPVPIIGRVTVYSVRVDVYGFCCELEYSVRRDCLQAGR